MIVGLCSSYREGPLLGGAVASLLEACDQVLVCEGPAGPRLENEADCPASEHGADERITQIVHAEGSWKTDAAKRTAMIAKVRGLGWLEGPTWGVWIDGDEILVNAKYLPDWLRYHDQVEEQTGRENLGWPLRLVEMDGSIATCQAKVIRLDRLDSYSVSSSVFKNVLGQLEVRGNYRLLVEDKSTAMVPHLQGLFDPRKNEHPLFQWPPLSCEPHIFHRSKLRHPLRQGLRLHEQEAVEIERVKSEIVLP